MHGKCSQEDSISEREWGWLELGLRGRHGTNTWSHGAVQERVLVAWSWENLFFTLQPVFHVMGFSVTGRVLNGPDGEGVPEAVVTLNNQIKVKTKADGSFRLENIKRQ